MKLSKLLIGSTVLTLASFLSIGAALASPPKNTIVFKEGYNGPDYLDPAVAYDTLSWAILNTTCAKMYTYGDNEASQTALEPEVAKDFPVLSNGGKTLTIKLHNTFKFSDGSKVTSKSFKRALERTVDLGMDTFDQGGVPGQSFFGEITSMSTPDNNTLVINLSNPVGDMVPRLTMNFACAVPENTPIAKLGLTQVPMAGPYYFKKVKFALDPELNGAPYNRFEFIEVQKNPHYKGKREAQAQKIRFIMDNLTPDYAGNKSAVLNNELDAAPLLGEDVLDIKANYPNLYFKNSEVGVSFLSLNASSDTKLLAQAKARRALNMVVDREALLNISPAYPATTPLANPDNGTPFSHYLPVGVPGSQATEPYNVTSSVADSPANIAAAHALMADAIAACPACSKSLTYMFRASPAANAAFGSADQLKADIEGAFGDLGVSVTLVNRYPLGLTSFVKTNLDAWDIFPAGWFADYLDGYDFLNIFFDQNSTINYGKFGAVAADAVWQAQLDAASATPVGPARDLAYGNLDQALAANAAPILVYRQPNSLNVLSDRIQGCPPVFGGFGLVLNKLCIKKGK